MITFTLMKHSLPQAIFHYCVYVSFLSHCEAFPELHQSDCKKTCNSSLHFSFLLLLIHQMPVYSYVSPAFISGDWTCCYSWLCILNAPEVLLHTVKEHPHPMATGVCTPELVRTTHGSLSNRLISGGVWNKEGWWLCCLHCLWQL